MNVIAEIRRHASDEIRDAATGALPAGALAAAGYVDVARWVASHEPTIADAPTRIVVKSSTSRQLLIISAASASLTLQGVALNVNGLTILTDQWAAGNLDVNLPAGAALIWVEGEEAADFHIWPGRSGAPATW